MLARFGLAVLAMVLVVGSVGSSRAQAPTEQRLGLVIGNSEYKAGPLATAANDAGLIAQTLQAAGFDVMGARDLDNDALRNTFRDFVDKVSAAGSGTVAVVYLAGHGLQFEGENYFVPVDARIERDLDVPLQALRLSDYVRPLSGRKGQTVMVVLDMARETPFARTGKPLAGGLALVEPSPGVLYAFNAAPGTIAPADEPPYGSYAKALAEMIREGGLPVGGVFDRVRLRVHEATSGAAVPWHQSQVSESFMFFEREADAPPEVSLTSVTQRRSKPIRAFDDAKDAYLAALERDTLQGYLDFLAAYPRHPQAGRVRAIVAARREATTWRRTRNADTPEAYWSYLDRYPKGPHAADAERRLAFLTAPPRPPRVWTRYEYDLPPPPEEEIIYVERPVVYFADPIYRFERPPPPPIFFLPPPPMAIFFRPPPRPTSVYVLPVPVYTPVPNYVRPPRNVAPPPPSNVIYNPRPPRSPQPGVGGPGAPGPGTPGPEVQVPDGRPGSEQPGAGQQAGSPVPTGPGPQTGQTGQPAQTGQGGQTVQPSGGLTPGMIAGGVAAGAIAGAAAASVALPPTLQKKAVTTPAALPGTGPGGVQRPGVTAPSGTTTTVVPGAPLTKGLQTVPGKAGVGVPGAAVPKGGPGRPATTAVVPPAGVPGKALPGTPSGAPLPPVQGKALPVAPGKQMPVVPGKQLPVVQQPGQIATPPTSVPNTGKPLPVGVPPAKGQVVAPVKGVPPPPKSVTATPVGKAAPTFLPPQTKQPTSPPQQLKQDGAQAAAQARAQAEAQAKAKAQQQQAQAAAQVKAKALQQQQAAQAAAQAKAKAQQQQQAAQAAAQAKARAQQQQQAAQAAAQAKARAQQQQQAAQAAAQAKARAQQQQQAAQAAAQARARAQQQQQAAQAAAQAKARAQQQQQQKR